LKETGFLNSGEIFPPRIEEIGKEIIQIGFEKALEGKPLIGGK